MANQMTEEELRENVKTSVDRWYKRISEHLQGIGNMTGFTIAILGAFVALSENNLNFFEIILLIAIGVIVFIQASLWIEQLERDREISFQDLQAARSREEGDANNHNKYEKQADYLKKLNTEKGKRLNQSVRWSIGLILLLIVVHAVNSFHSRNVASPKNYHCEYGFIEG